jgi:hypothetical protein
LTLTDFLVWMAALRYTLFTSRSESASMAGHC